MFAFFGTSHHSAEFLELALQNGLKIDLVVSAPPKPIGKEQILAENPVIVAAKSLNLSYLSDLSNLRNLRNLNLGLMLDFNKIIPAETIALFTKGIINIHFSRLPQYRGPAPVQYTILNGDRLSWITYYLIDENVDTGKIIAQTSLPLNLTENTETLYQKLMEKAGNEIKNIIDTYLSDRYHTCQQTGTPTYSKKLKTEDCQIDWTKPAEQIERLIRAVSPEPGAWTTIELKVKNSKLKVMRLKILKAHLESKRLVLDQVQLEGKNPVTWKQFKEGHLDSKITL